MIRLKLPHHTTKGPMPRELLDAHNVLRKAGAIYDPWHGAWAIREEETVKLVGPLNHALWPTNAA